MCSWRCLPDVSRALLLSHVAGSRSVAMGQRAPNRATAREEGRGLGAGMKGGTGAMGPPRTRTPERARDRDRRACVACPLGLWVLPGVIKHCLAWL